MLTDLSEPAVDVGTFISGRRYEFVVSLVLVVVSIFVVNPYTYADSSWSYVFKFL